MLRDTLLDTWTCLACSLFSVPDKSRRSGRWQPCTWFSESAVEEHFCPRCSFFFTLFNMQRVCDPMSCICRVLTLTIAVTCLSVREEPFVASALDNEGGRYVPKLTLLCNAACIRISIFKLTI